MVYGKIIISGTLSVVTGLHIGGLGTYSPIGSVDSPVIKDLFTNQPIIPGSSLKGKLRTLLVKSIEGKLPNIKKDPQEVKRLFGSTTDYNDKREIIPSRLQFADAFVSNAERFAEIGLTEIKMENTINRASSVAKPRQIERVIKGVEFKVIITYDLVDKNEFMDDMKNLARAMKLLQLDYLGGHGTRGSGRVKFTDIKLECVPFADCDIDISPAQKIFEDEVSRYELIPAIQSNAK